MEMSNISDRRSISLPENLANTDVASSCEDKYTNNQSCEQLAEPSQASKVGVLFNSAAFSFKRAFSFSGKDANS